MKKIHIWFAFLLALFYLGTPFAGINAYSSTLVQNHIIEPSNPFKTKDTEHQFDPARKECINTPDDIRLIGVSPYTNKISFDYLAPAVRSLNLRLSEIIKACKSEGIPACHVFQGAYGSGFLRENVLGNDLDYMLAVGLGRITVAQSNTGSAAREIIKRMDSYLRIFHRVINSRPDPDLSVMNWGALGREGLKKNNEFEERLARLLCDTVKGNSHLVLLKSREGALVPNALPFGDGYLYENTGIKFVSRKIRYNDRMFAGLREFSVMLHFLFDLEIEGPEGRSGSTVSISLDPTYIPRGQVLDLMDSFLWTVPAGSASARFFREELIKNLDQLVKSRPHRCISILFQCEQLFLKRDIMKALKRLHQGFDWIYPVFDNSFRAGISAFLSRNLHNEDALLCQEIAEMAQMTGTVLKDPSLLQMYYNSGDIRSTLVQMSKDLMELEDSHAKLFQNGNSELRKCLEKACKIFDSCPYPDQEEKASELLRRIERSAREYLIGFIPDSEKIPEFRKRILEKLYRAGFSVLPVYGLKDGSLGVLKNDLKGITSLDMLNKDPGKTGAPAFTYRIISESEIPVDNTNGRPYPYSKLILRSGQSAKEEENYRNMMDSLNRDMDLFIYSITP